jgi:hypothetical protein
VSLEQDQSKVPATTSVTAVRAFIRRPDMTSSDWLLALSVVGEHWQADADGVGKQGS